MDQNKLRRLLVTFYQQHDPVALQQGIDVAGIVNFATENGIDALNNMLKKRYNGNCIDLSEDDGGVKQGFSRLSAAFTMSTQIAQTEQKYRQQLYYYFQKEDSAMISPQREQQFEKFVKFAMLNGMPTLSEKLKARYGKGIEGVEEADHGGEGNDASPVTEFVMTGQNPFGLDINRLRDDLQAFYIDNDDSEQLAVLDETVDWACQIGMEEFDGKLEQLYGMTLNEYLRSRGKQPHQNKSEEPVAPPPESVPSETMARSEYDEVEVEEEYLVGERAFDEMTDEEIRAELYEFYMEHDQENLEKMDQIIGLCRQCPRAQVNEMLVGLYDAEIVPIPIKKTRVVKQRVKRAVPASPKPSAPRNPLPKKQQISAREDDNDSGWEEPAPLPSRPQTKGPKMVVDFQPPAPKLNLPFNPAQAMNVNLRKAPAAPPGLKTFDADRPVVSNQPSWMDKVKKMQERIGAGAAEVSDGRGGKMTVNLLIDICKKYRINPMTGVCKCGFSKKDHSYLSRY